MLRKQCNCKVMLDVKAEQTAPVPTPHWGAQSGPAFTIRATTIVKARAASVLDALLNTSTWPLWNNFVPRASLSKPPSNSDTPNRLCPGIIFTEHVDMAGKGRSTIVKMKLLMTTLDELNAPGRRGYRVVWLGKGYPSWALRSERVHEIYEDHIGGETTYDVYETFSGPLAWAVRIFVGNILVKRFGQWNGELRDYVEETLRQQVESR